VVARAWRFSLIVLSAGAAGALWGGLGALALGLPAGIAAVFSGIALAVFVGLLVWRVDADRAA